jgi:hypothetical protein
MSSCTVCPCFKISASVSQLASSTGWSFHFTKYSKYCFLLVFLPTLLSSMRSIWGFCATGNCFCHWITGSSVPGPVSSVLYGYKSDMLKIGDIPMFPGNSRSNAFSPNFLRIRHGPIFFNLSLLYVPRGNLSFLKCARTKSPTAN